MKCLLASLGLILSCSSSTFAQETRRPNVLLIMTDDQGWGDLGVHGNPHIDTPTIDGLAAGSVRFDRFYVSPVCAPTRASLLTGRYHMRTGVTGVTRGQETMRADEVTIAELLKKAGYVTGCFGKWHNGAHYPNHPNGQGFDEFFGFCGGHWNKYFDTKLERNGRDVKTTGYITDVVTQAAMEFIDRNHEQPFFCYVPYNAPHGPFQVPDELFDKYTAKGLDAKTATVYGMCENIDDNVDRLLKTLEANNLSRNTIVIFLTDNGPNGARFNGGMRGTKGSAHEGGVRVPLFIRWPGHLPPGRDVKQIAAHIDLLPTISELCHVETTGTKPLDGISLVSLMHGENKADTSRMLFTHWGASRGQSVPLTRGAVRTQQYRLVNERKGYELYDMLADPMQKSNIAAKKPAVVRELRQAYENWHRDAVASGGLNTDTGVLRLPISVGYPQARRIDLPATEAYFKEPLRYINGSGFAHDWITDWNDSANKAWWDLSVARAGRYDVSVVGTFPEAAVGATVRVIVGDHSTEATITRAWNPRPGLRPDRTDSYKNRVIQTFVPLALGTIDLRKGRQKLTLSAEHDELGIDVHSVRLELDAPDRNYPPKLAGARVETYKTVGDVELQTWIFEPPSHSAEDGRPAVVFFFGGGWKRGTPAQFHRHCQYLALRGMVAMTAEYRVLKRHGTLAVDCIADAKSAIRWVRQNSDRLGIDPKRIVAGGGSAGGHLAACTGTVRDFDESGEDASISSVPNAMALFNPALMLATYKGQAPFDHERMYAMPDRVGARPAAASPVHHVRPGIPPTIIFHGKADDTVAFFTAELFTEAMRKAGNRCELSGFDGENHGFFNFGRGDGSAYTKTIEQLDQFLVSLGYLSEQSSR